MEFFAQFYFFLSVLILHESLQRLMHALISGQADDFLTQTINTTFSSKIRPDHCQIAPPRTSCTPSFVFTGLFEVMVSFSAGDFIVSVICSFCCCSLFKKLWFLLRAKISCSCPAGYKQCHFSSLWCQISSARMPPSLHVVPR